MRKMIGGLLVSLLLLAGCGSSGTDQAKTLPEHTTPGSKDQTPKDLSTSATTSAPKSEAELRSMLLTVADMPSGYTYRPPGESGDDSDDDFCNDAFAELDAITGSNEDDPEAEADFQKGEPGIMGGAFVSESLGSYEEARLAKAFEKMPDAFDNCRRISTTDEDGTKTTGTFAPLSFDQVGDQTFAMHLTANVSDPDGRDVRFGGDMVFVREGSIVMLVFAFGFGALNVPIDELEQIVNAAHSKLEGTA